jgi:hypothetical protein
MPFMSEMEVEHGGFAWGMSQVALDEPRIDAGFQQRGGIRMAEGMNGHAGFGNVGTVFGFAESALDTRATHRSSRRRTLGMIPPGGRKEPGGVPMGFPGGAEQREGLGGQGDVAVLGALTAMDMDLEALTVNIGDLQGEGVMESESQAIDGGEVDLIVEGCGRLEEPPDLLDTEHGREPVGVLRAPERQGVPVALEDVRREEADTAVANTHGRGGEAIDVFPVEEVVLKLLCRDAVGGFVVELGQQADFPDIGRLGALALATEWKSRKHVLTQWGHEISPFVSGRVVRV